jgi:CBS domain-containing protein
MTPSPTTFAPSDTVESVRKMLVGFRHAPVVENGRFQGYLHACDLAWQDGERTLEALALGAGVVVPSDTPLNSALNRLRSSRHDILFIGEPAMPEGGPELEGVFTEHDGIRAVLAALSPTALARPVDRIASRPVDIVTPDTRVGDVRAQLATRWFRHLPVVVDGRAVGMISWRDVAVGDDDTACEAVMTAPVWTVGPETPLGDVARRMLQGRVGAIPLVEDDAVVGIVTRTDLFAALLDVAEVA